MGRPSKPLLTRPAIARVALALIDEAGAHALTLRAVATRMGVKPQSLYNHVQSKDDLLDAVTEAMDEGIDVSALADPDWRRGLERAVRAYRDTFARHPEAVPVIARRPVETRAALSSYDALLAGLVRAGLTPAEAVEVIAAIDYLVLGSALETFTAGFTRTPEQYRPDHPVLADCLAGADSPEAGGLATLDERGFTVGLQLLLDGLSARLAARPGS